VARASSFLGTLAVIFAYAGRHAARLPPLEAGRGWQSGQALHECEDTNRETLMDDDTLNLSIRKFLKMVGVNSQREIEQAVAKTVAAGAGAETFAATMTLEIPELALKVKFDGDIKLH
jgi:Family of unknown function (DUF6494)